MSQLWKDEAGFIVSADLILVSSILVLGMMVGLVSIRDQIVQELGDVSMAFAGLRQTYTWQGITGHTSSVAGSVFQDSTDFCDSAGAGAPGDPPGGILLDMMAMPERLAP